MRTLRLALAASLAAALAAVTATAQHAGHATDTKQAALVPGLGAVTHPVTTKNAEAQKYFDQGLALIYGFNHESASKSFKRASELDPNLAMAYWGFAYAVGPNYNEPTIDLERMKAAYEAVKKAQQLAGGATERERAYINALAKRFSLDAQPDVKRLGQAYMEAMREVYKNYPDDLDAATLYADSLMNLNPWQLWTKEGEPSPGTEEIVQVLESALARDPNHMGANHLYIHAVEASRTPQRALPSAKRLETLAPSAGHLVHMPGHIYLRTGDYESSAKTNEVAAEADREYLKRTGTSDSMYAGMYYSHNLHFLVESYSRMGMYAEALRSAAQLENNARGHIQMMPMLEGFLPSPLLVRMRFAKWEEVLKLPEPDKALRIVHSIWQFSRAVALAKTGKVGEAEKAQAAFRDEIKALPDETPFGLNSAQTVLAVAENELAARIAWAKGDKAKSIESWQKAVAAQDALNYDEPPAWYHPARESLGAALLESGSAAQAEQTFRADLKQNPRNGRSLFGLKESLKAQGKTDSAMMVEREFEQAWKRADSPLKIADL